MTATGVLLGRLIGVFILGTVIVFAFFSNRERVFGYKNLTNMVHRKLPDAGVGSRVSAEFPIPSVEARVEVAGRRAGINSYRLELRMGYKRNDHLEIVKSVLASHEMAFERIDKGNGMIKLRTEKRDEPDDMIAIAKGVKSAIMYDLSDSQIKVTQTLR